MIHHLEENGIVTRRMFGGNIICQPGFQNLPYISVPDLDGANKMMEQTLWIGCYPGVSDDDIRYISNTFEDFFSSRSLF